MYLSAPISTSLSTILHWQTCHREYALNRKWSALTLLIIIFHFSCFEFTIFIYGIPCVIVGIFNIITFVCSCVVVIKLKVQHEKMKESCGQSDQRLPMSTRKACKLLVSLTGILCMLGLPWIAIGLVHVFLYRTVTHLLFIVYNSLQGFLLFIFFTAINPELRNRWIKLLCRCWVKKKHSFLPKHKTPSTSVNLSEECSSEENMRTNEQNEWPTHTHNHQISCFVHNTYHLLSAYAVSKNL